MFKAFEDTPELHLSLLLLQHSFWFTQILAA